MSPISHLRLLVWCAENTKLTSLKPFQAMTHTVNHTCLSYLSFFLLLGNESHKLQWSHFQLHCCMFLRSHRIQWRLCQKAFYKLKLCVNGHFVAAFSCVSYQHFFWQILLLPKLIFLFFLFRFSFFRFKTLRTSLQLVQRVCVRHWHSLHHLQLVQNFRFGSIVGHCHSWCNGSNWNGVIDNR